MPSVVALLCQQSRASAAGLGGGGMDNLSERALAEVWSTAVQRVSLTLQHVYSLKIINNFIFTIDGLLLFLFFVKKKKSKNSN